MSEAALPVPDEQPEPLGRDFTVIGRPIHRRESVEKVTGRALYAGDIKRPGMLHAKILRSPHAHARIKKIDVSKAEAVDGVKAILTKDNTPGWITYWYMIPQPAFPTVVTFAGQEVAAVAATDIDTARKALQLIDVEYEVLPHVLDPEAAMTENSPYVQAYEDPTGLPFGLPKDFPFVGPRKGNVFIGKPYVLKRGDVEKGFEEADLVVEDKFRTPPTHHGTLQTRTCVAEWDGQKLTVWESSQAVWQPAEQLARSLGLPVEKVRVMVKFQGGGFGGKAGAQRFSHYASRLSMVTGRPVRLELTRSEEFVSHPRRHYGTIYLKTGVRRDGTLTAMCGKAVLSIGSGGSYQGLLIGTGNVIAIPFNLYNCPNAYFEQYGVYTNSQYTGNMRSPQIIIGDFAIESHVDRIAHELGMDPIEFRTKNYTPYGDQVDKIPYSRKRLDRCMELVADAINWSRRTTLAQDNAGKTLKRGIGIANYFFHGVGFPPFRANAEVSISPDGTIELRAGIVDIGGGSATTLPMIAAEELGVDLEDVEIVHGDTENTKYAPGSHASRVIPEMGPAVLQAASRARKKLFQFASRILDVPPERLQSAHGYIYIRDQPSKRIRYEEACKNIPEGETIRAEGSRTPNPRNVKFATFGSQAVEVEVDTETGHVEVVKVATSHEFGRALNPKFCMNQHNGGVVMGLAHALFEEAVMDEKSGVMLNQDLHQYRLATSLEFPPVDAFNVEDDDPYFAYSAKGGGEGVNTPAPAAIRNAICQAIGCWINEFPLTPDRILNAIAQTKDAT